VHGRDRDIGRLIRTGDMGRLEYHPAHDSPERREEAKRERERERENRGGGQGVCGGWSGPAIAVTVDHTRELGLLSCSIALQDGQVVTTP
jgi:hypothetical protein